MIVVNKFIFHVNCSANSIEQAKFEDIGLSTLFKLVSDLLISDPNYQRPAIVLVSGVDDVSGSGAFVCSLSLYLSDQFYLFEDNEQDTTAPPASFQANLDTNAAAGVSEASVNTGLGGPGSIGGSSSTEKANQPTKKSLLFNQQWVTNRRPLCFFFFFFFFLDKL